MPQFSLAKLIKSKHQKILSDVNHLDIFVVFIHTIPECFTFFSL